MGCTCSYKAKEHQAQTIILNSLVLSSGYSDFSQEEILSSQSDEEKQSKIKSSKLKKQLTIFTSNQDDTLKVFSPRNKDQKKRTLKTKNTFINLGDSFVIDSLSQNNSLKSDFKSSQSQISRSLKKKSFLFHFNRLASIKSRKKLVKETREIKKHKANGQKFVNEYIVLNEIGQGGFGKVKRAMRKIGDKKIYFAIKVFKRSFLKLQQKKIKDTYIIDELQKVFREIAIMKKLNHPNIVILYEVLDDQKSDKIYLIMEYCRYGSILKWSEKKKMFQRTDEKPFDYLEEDWIRKIFREILSAVYYSEDNKKCIHQEQFIEIQNLKIYYQTKNTQQKFVISEFHLQQMMVQTYLSHKKEHYFLNLLNQLTKKVPYMDIQVKNLIFGELAQHYIVMFILSFLSFLWIDCNIQKTLEISKQCFMMNEQYQILLKIF